MSTSDLYDLTVAAIVIGFTIRGYMKGLIHQLGALISLIIGVIVSFRFTPLLAPYMFGNENIKSVAAFIILLNLATLIVWGIANLISRLISDLKLNSWNNQMGALLGIFYGVLCAMALTFVLLIYANPAPTSAVDENGNPIAAQASNDSSFIMESKTGPYLTTVALTTIDHLPQAGDCKFYDYWRDYFQMNASDIKKNNPDLLSKPEPDSAPEGTVSDENKPQLPISFTFSSSP